MKSKVYSSIPRAGLGNMLLVWARGYAFAHKHSLEFAHSGFMSFQPGPWLRREKSKRLYWNIFISQSLSKLLRYKYYRAAYKKEIDPVFDVIVKHATLYEFRKLFISSDYFLELKPYKKEIKQALFSMLHPRLKKKLESLEAPVIGLHIRRGDFKLGSTLTPLSFFIGIVQQLRSAAGVQLPATVFSDATDDELSELLALPSITRSNEKEDIVDLLLLSRSRFLVLSISSSFSLWAAFLSEGQIIKNPAEWHPDIRPPHDNELLFEGKVDAGKPLPQQLTKHLLSL